MAGECCGSKTSIRFYPDNDLTRGAHKWKPGIIVCMLVFWVLGCSLLASIGCVGVAALVLRFPAATRQILLPYLISFATGTLLATALLRLLPHAMEHLGGLSSLHIVLGGLVTFFILERLMIWRHCHVVGHCDTHNAAGPLILVGDTLHNFVDGVVLAAAFLTSLPLGVATGLAVLLHEIPQEVGDFAILLDSGFSRRTAFRWNMLSALATIPGALLGLVALERLEFFIPYVLAFSAAGFLYVGLADLISGLHQRLRPRIGMMQFLLFILGILTILLLPVHEG